MSTIAPIRELRAGDVDALGDVLARAYVTPQDFRSRLRAYLVMRGARTFVAGVDGAPAGIVVGNDYGPSAYVALMGVDPRLQRHGIATRLMTALLAWADERGFAALELDATDAGAPLYERCGFADLGRTLVYTADGPGGAADAARRARPADVPALLAFDRAAFGADRRAVLEPLIATPGASVFVAGADGGIDGYAIAQGEPGSIGPVVAAGAASAGALIDAARAALNVPFRISATTENGAAAALLEQRGFRFARSLRHMVRGVRPPAARERIFARVNLGQG